MMCPISQPSDFWRHYLVGKTRNELISKVCYAFFAIRTTVFQETHYIADGDVDKDIVRCSAPLICFAFVIMKLSQKSY